MINPETNKISIMISEIKININPAIIYNSHKLINEIQIQQIHEENQEENPDYEFCEDMWLPKKISTELPEPQKRITPMHSFFHETILFVAPSIAIIFNSPQTPLIICRISCDLELREHCNFKLTAQANYYNVNNNKWEPLIEPVGNDFEPYELNVNIFRTAALPLTSRAMQSDPKVNRVAMSALPTNVTDTSGDSDSDSGEIMSFMKPPPERVLVSPSPPLGIGGESDGEDDVIERITSTLSYLFTRLVKQTGVCFFDLFFLEGVRGEI